MESSAGPFSPCSAPKGGGLGALLSRVFALHSGAPAAAAEPQALPGSREPLLSRPPPGARAPYPAVLARPRRADTPDSKMASVVPLKDKRLMDVKLGELPTWIRMRDFSPKGIAGAFQRGYYRYYNKYIDVKKGGVAGVSMVLAAYVLFNYIRSYHELKHERRRKYH